MSSKEAAFAASGATDAPPTWPTTTPSYSVRMQARQCTTTDGVNFVAAGVKSDERLYLFNVGTQGQFVDGFYQSGFQHPKPEEAEWGKLTLPFESFNRTHKGFVRGAACVARAQVVSTRVFGIGGRCLSTNT